MRKNLIDSTEILQGSVSTEEVISTLHEVITNLNSSNTHEEEKQIIESFYHKVEKWQVILIKPHQYKIWMQSPMEYYETKRRIGFLERARHFLARGAIVGSESTERYAGIMSNTTFPLEVDLNPLQTIVAMESREGKFYFAVTSILKRIKDFIVEHGVEELAIYERPAGIVAMNNSKHYLNEIGKLTHMEMSQICESIEVVPFSNLIDKSVIESSYNTGK